MKYVTFLQEHARATANPEVHAYLARRALALGRIDEARQYIQQIIKLPRDVHEVAAVSEIGVTRILEELRTVRVFLGQRRFAEELLATIEQSKDFKRMQNTYARTPLGGNKLKTYVESTENPDKEILEGFFREKAAEGGKRADEFRETTEQHIEKLMEKSPEFKREVEEGELKDHLESVEKGETEEQQREREEEKDETMAAAIRLVASRQSVADSLHEHPKLYEIMQQAKFTNAKRYGEWDKHKRRLAESIAQLLLKDENIKSKLNLKLRQARSIGLTISIFIHDEQFYSHLIARRREEAEAKDAIKRIERILGKNFVKRIVKDSKDKDN